MECSVSQQLPTHRLAVRGSLEATREDIKAGREGRGKGQGKGLDHAELSGRSIHSLVSPIC